MERCLKSSLPFVDEIIIVDTGSTDKTKEIARKFTDKIYDFVWVDDFSKARNYALSKAHGKYLFWLDADDVITEDNLKKLLKLKNNIDPSTDVYMLKYEVAFDKLNNPTFSYYRERIFKNDNSFFFVGAVHEAVAIHGKVERLDISIKHIKLKPTTPGRNLKIYEKLKKIKPFNERENYYYGRELYYNKKYSQAISALNKVINKKDAWTENVLGALEIKADCLIALNKPDKAFNVLCQSFRFSPARANFLCKIGDIFFVQKKYSLAAFWYENALNCKKDYSTGAFIVDDYYGYYPALQLCVVNYNQKQFKKAKEFNELALAFKPNDEIATANKSIFT